MTRSNPVPACRRPGHGRDRRGSRRLDLPKGWETVLRYSPFDDAAEMAARRARAGATEVVAMWQLGMWSVIRCPYCGEQHDHDDGGPHGDRAEALKRVPALCGRGEYTLTPAPHRVIPVAWLQIWGPRTPTAHDLFHHTDPDVTAEIVAHAPAGAPPPRPLYLRWRGQSATVILGGVVWAVRGDVRELVHVALPLRGVPTTVDAVLVDVTPETMAFAPSPGESARIVEIAKLPTRGVVVRPRPDFEAGGWNRGA